METIRLNNGVEIPCIGIGPGSVMRGKTITFWGSSFLGKTLNKIFTKFLYIYKKKKQINSLVRSFKMGYRLIDYSAAYGNEELIRIAIDKSGYKREEFFITSRISNKQQFTGKIREALMQTLKKMKLDYIDLYMFHWPVTDHYINTYKELENLYNEGFIKAIGVANCHQHHLEKILKECHLIPALNQIEVHPLFTQKPLIEYCKSKGIVIEAYTPLARNDDRLCHNKILEQIALKYNKTIAQVILRWNVQQEIIPIPRSSNAKRQKENISIFDFKLTDEDIKAIDSININSRLRYDPDNCDFSRL